MLMSSSFEPLRLLLRDRASTSLFIAGGGHLFESLYPWNDSSISYMRFIISVFTVRGTFENGLNDENYSLVSRTQGF